MFLSVLFIECIELNWNGKDANGLCFYIFLKDIGWYLVVIGNLNNDELIKYIFTDKFLNGTPSIFNISNDHCWYKELRNQFSTLMIDTTH